MLIILLTRLAYNPIEHRLFPHLTRACSRVIFDSWETVKSLMEKAQTRTGLKVFATILEQVYETGKKVAKDFKKTMSIVFVQAKPATSCSISSSMELYC